MTVVVNPARTEEEDMGCAIPTPLPTLQILDLPLAISPDENLDTPTFNVDYISPTSDADLIEPSIYSIEDSPEPQRETYISSSLYDNERQSDIIFVAGINGDTYRFPGHRRVLAASNPVFAALLKAKTDVIVIDYLDHKGFENLLKYYYCEPSQLTTVPTARSTLEAAYKFLCPQLVERSAHRLDLLLDVEVALYILRDLRLMCSKLPGAASVPPLPLALCNEGTKLLFAQCAGYCDMLAHNALLVLDDNADAALQHENLEDLSHEDLTLIVKRDTLRVSNEIILIEALSRWSTAFCKKYKRELTARNKRTALGELAYCPRYLLLQGEELDRGLGYELLQPTERTLVIARSKKLSAPIPVGAYQEHLLRRWARPRPTTPAAAMAKLSSRSIAVVPDEPQPMFCGLGKKRLKEPNYLVVNPVTIIPQPKSCCAKFFDGLIRVLICLFD